MASGSGSPCGACKFLRRKCAPDCVFAPYFRPDQGGAGRFAAVHKVFGASNASKLLLHVPAADRWEAMLTIAYEAQARVSDPVYGCVAHIFALQQQVAWLQAQLTQMKAQLAQNLIDASISAKDQWPENMVAAPYFPASSSYMGSVSSQGSQESMDQSIGEMGIHQEFESRDEYFLPSFYSSKKGASQSDHHHQLELGELHALALSMMRN
ncbi:LOB domain-containing protein 16-like [Diospyros lotus]|uniref:LOB domain-containing protein 16-like n=1 Tax=Diospyros lotus TaxID=55363 RepID=UPI0022570794|nr:LOB domain-containing protein 16-like [Diospyros lotus]